MIAGALSFLVAELNAFQKARTGSDFGKAELTRLVDDNGKWAVPQDQFGVALVNVQENRIFPEQLPSTTFLSGQQIALEPKLQLDLHVMFAGNFKLYDQALHQLSLIMTFFQAHSTFSVDEYPGLDPRIGLLTVQLQSLSFDQLNQVWAYLGGKHLPSALYLVRMVTLQDVEPTSVQPPITKITASVHGR